VVNVPKRLVGATVRVTWADPNTWRGDIRDLVRGRAALATWREYGEVIDVTDGVVLLAHSIAQSPGKGDDEVQRTAVPEALIESLVVLVPEKGDSTA